MGVMRHHLGSALFSADATVPPPHYFASTVNVQVHYGDVRVSVFVAFLFLLCWCLYSAQVGLDVGLPLTSLIT